MKHLGLGVAAGAAALSALAVSPALSQSGISALQGHNTNAPVDVAADRIEVQDRADRAIFSGNVVVRQASLTLNAARLTVAYSDAGGIQIQRLDASGGVTVRSPSETARGQFAIYDLSNRLITLLGGVTLTRGESRVSGGRLVIDLSSGRAVMDGGGPAGTRTEGGRVTGTFTVPQRND
ncbi:MAG TPA: LptA/OstA family protein [Allosphingosinicella sp.]|nr:LptA/OstA family protein [Allosphingosinicella sp.]